MSERNNNEQTVVERLYDEEHIKKSFRYQKTVNDLVNKSSKKLENQIYLKNGFWKDLFVLSIAALVTTISMDYFIASTGSTGLFPSGLSTIVRFLAIITFKDSPNLIGSFYFIYYFLFNIPLIIFGVIKLGYRFSITTFIFITLSMVFDQLINLIPVINPTEWHLIVDYSLIDSIPGEWSSGIWLFIFGIIGGITLGWAYSQTYRVASSTGGIDFISMYIAKKYNKNIGKINMKINFVLLLIVITLNTMTIETSEINQTIKYSVLTNEIKNIQELNNFINTHNVGDILNGIDKTDIGLVLATLSKSSEFTDYDSSMVILMKCKFILGPSLAASAIMIICQSITVDIVYPKNRILTIMITTSEQEKVREFLFNSGYKNDVFIWQTATWKKGVDVKDKTVLMIQMTIYNWKQLNDGLINIDESMNINIEKTMKVEGSFEYTLDDEKMKQILREKVISNPKLMKKIESEALNKFSKKQ